MEHVDKRAQPCSGEIEVFERSEGRLPDNNTLLFGDVGLIETIYDRVNAKVHKVRGNYYQKGCNGPYFFGLDPCDYDEHAEERHARKEADDASA